MKVCLPAKILIGVFFAFYLFFSSLTRISAQSAASQSAAPTTPQTNPDVPQNLHTFSQSVVIELLAAFSCQLVGIDPINPTAKCLGVDKTTGKIGFVEQGGGAMGAMGSLIGATFNIPLSSTDYLAYLGENFGLTKKAYAQGTTGGFTALSPLRNLWVAFRNIVYLLFVIALVFVGLGIMLRLQIDPRTVMTIQNQIPKIIIGLILVTFSYAIAGLLVDLMWMTTYLSANTIVKADPAINLAVVNREITSAPIGFANSLFEHGSLPFEGGIIHMTRQATVSVNSIIEKTFGLITPDELKLNIPGGGNKINCNAPSLTTKQLIDGGCVAALTILDQGQLTLQQKFATFIWSFFSWIPGLLAFFVILIALFIAFFRLWIQLIKAYVFILIDVVLAPFWIMLGILPGGPGGGFGGWMRDILANLAAFPVTIIMFLLGRVFMDVFGTAAGSSQLLVPLIGGLNAQGLAGLIGIGIVLMTPEVVTMTRDYLKAPPFKYTAAIGAAMGAGAASATELGKLAATYKVGYEPINQKIEGFKALRRRLLGL